MSATVIVRSILTNALAGNITSERIVMGVIPIKTVLPAISVSLVSAVPRKTIGMHEKNRAMVARVQVSVVGRTYKECSLLFKNVRYALSNRDELEQENVLSILPDVVGPDVQDVDTSTYQQSQDYMITYIV